MILLLDNYDSFTFNLYQALARQGEEVRVVRNDALGVDELLLLGARAIVLSPGPGRPSEAGVQPELLARLPSELPLLGVCLGMQGLVEHYGGIVAPDPEPVHGRASLVHHDHSPLFEGLPSPFPAARYHSLVARPESLPAELALCAWTTYGTPMAVRHQRLPRFGVQFHPESILTPDGERLLANFALRIARPAGALER